jgi:hypothetical protein
MEMVGHETVRNDCKASIGPTPQNLPKNQFDAVSLDEVATALICAECQGISVQTDIVEGGEVTGIAGKHDRRTPQNTVRVRLKADTTYATERRSG